MRSPQYWARSPEQLAQAKLDEKFIAACKRGAFKRAKELLAQGCSVYTKTPNSTPMIHWAAEQNKPALIHFLVECGLDLTDDRSKNQGGFHPILSAARAKSSDAVKALIELGSDPGFKSENGHMPLRLCAEGSMARQTPQKIETAKVLLAAGADPNQRGPANYTAVHECVESGSVEMFALLLRHGGDPHIVSCHGKTAVQMLNTINLDKARLMRSLVASRDATAAIDAAMSSPLAANTSVRP